MKKALATALLLGMAVIGYGQKASDKAQITYGENFKAAKRLNFYQMMGEQDGKMYGLFMKAGMRGASYSIGRVNASLEMEALEEVPFSVKGEDGTFAGYVMFAGKMYLFTSIAIKRSNENDVYAQSLNLKSLKPEGPVTKVGTLEYKTAMDMMTARVQFAISDDGSKLVIYNQKLPNKGEKATLEVQVYNTDMQQLWQKEISLPYESDLFRLENVVLDNSGDAYVLGKVLANAKEANKLDPEGRYMILAYDAKGEAIGEFQADFEDKYISSMIVKTDDPNHLFCAGFYRGGEKAGTSGTIVAKINRTTKEVQTLGVEEFSLDFITQDLPQAQAKKAKKQADKGKVVGLRGVKTRELIQREDGGFLLIGEQEWTESIMTIIQGQQYPGIAFYFMDIPVVSISPEGNVEWATKIPKHQRSENDFGQFSGYGMLAKNDKLYFIFNDNPKNLPFSSDNKLKEMTPNDAVLAIAVIDAKGNIKRESLLGSKAGEVVARPNTSFDINDSELVFFGSKGKDNSFIKMTVAD